MNVVTVLQARNFTYVVS